MSELQNRANSVKLYHGSVMPDLKYIKANIKSHTRDHLNGKQSEEYKEFLVWNFSALWD